MVYRFIIVELMNLIQFQNVESGMPRLSNLALAQPVELVSRSEIFLQSIAPSGFHLAPHQFPWIKIER